jgi:L,D-transpeptidase YbiS
MHPPPHAARLCREEAIQLGMNHKAGLLVADVDSQTLLVVLGDGSTSTYPISTSRNGLGEIVNSYQTPRGFHEVCERIGDKLPVGSVFKSRQFTGEILTPEKWSEPDGDKILTRILRLRGLVPGFNAGGPIDSYERMIYLHGTNQEQYVGVKPSSIGCIRLKNRDIISLFDAVKDKPAWCWIGSLRDYVA